jgi:hypothetical protein
MSGEWIGMTQAIWTQPLASAAALAAGLLMAVLLRVAFVMKRAQRWTEAAPRARRVWRALLAGSGENNAGSNPAAERAWLVQRWREAPVSVAWAEARSLGQSLRGNARAQWRALVEDAGLRHRALLWMTDRGARRVAGLRLLASIDHASVHRERLQAMCTDEDPSVRAAAYGWLARDREIDVATLVQGASDSHPLVEQTVLEWLPTSGVIGEAAAQRLLSSGNPSVVTAVLQLFGSTESARSIQEQDDVRRLLEVALPLLHYEHFGERRQGESALIGAGRAGQLLLTQHRREQARR